MVVYKYERDTTFHSYRDRVLVYGHLEDKEVDKFNPPIKVFVPFAHKELDGTVSYRAAFNRNAVTLYQQPRTKEEEWVYLSEIKVEEASKKELKAIREAIEEAIEESNSQTDIFTQFKEELKEK